MIRQEVAEVCQSFGQQPPDGFASWVDWVNAPPPPPDPRDAVGYQWEMFE